jgi:hypothetical protein
MTSTSDMGARTTSMRSSSAAPRPASRRFSKTQFLVNLKTARPAKVWLGFLWVMRMGEDRAVKTVYSAI